MPTKYTPLNSEHSEIRLLTILPDELNREVRCSLGIISINSSPKFEALSYVWGDETIKKTITVDDHPFQVTVNLEAALRHLRWPQKPRVLWVDAICINQDNIPEKNVQVPLMSKLYTGATSVVVWLGDSSPNMELAASWINTYVEKKPTKGSAFWLKLDAGALFSQKAKYEKNLAILQAFEGYYDICNLAYWTRMWTFQEYRLPKIEPTCICGDFSFQATTFMYSTKEPLLKARSRAYDQLLNSTKSGSREEGIVKRADVEELLRKNTVVLEKLEAKPSLTLAPNLARFGWYEDSSGNSLQIYIISTGERKCFNPLDKIFALYGVVPKLQEIYPPDYGKPVSQVMLETTSYIVNYEKSVEVYTTFGLCKSRLSDTSHPSWVLDFSQVGPSAPYQHHSFSTTSVGSLHWKENPPSLPIVSADNTTLHIWARSLGSCNTILQFDTDTKRILGQIVSLLQLTSVDLDADSIWKTARNPQGLRCRIARACMAHVDVKYTTDELLEGYGRALNYVASDKHLGNTSYMINQAVALLAGKVLVMASTGCFGICVADVEEEDIVVFAPNFEVPLVLRISNQDGIGKSAEYYRMVGTAYFDGFGREECFDKEFIAEIGQQEFREYYIN